MIVRMRTNYSGPRGQARAGKHINLPLAEARELIDGGYAVKVRPPADAEVIQSAAPSIESDAEMEEPPQPKPAAKRRATKAKE